jgi:hypothetical protein
MSVPLKFARRTWDRYSPLKTGRKYSFTLLIIYIKYKSLFFKLYCPEVGHERESFDPDALAGRRSLSGLEGQGVAS